MNPWKKLFGTDSPKVGIVQRKPSGSPAIPGDQLASFHEALRNEDLKRVVALLTKNSSLANAEVESGKKPLHLAADK